MKKGNKKEPLERLKDVEKTIIEDMPPVPDCNKEEREMSTDIYHMDTNFFFKQASSDATKLKELMGPDFPGWPDGVLKYVISTPNIPEGDAIKKIYKPDFGISAAMATICDEIAALTDKYRTNCCNLLVRYARQSLLNSHHSQKADIKQASYMTDMLDLLSRRVGSSDASPLPTADKILTDTVSSFHTIYNFLMDQWEHIADSSYTYRLLSVMAQTQEWPDDPVARAILANTICVIYANRI